MKGHFHFAEKKGYSGVGLYTPHDAERRASWASATREFDAEGRYVEAALRHAASASSRASSAATFPSGSSGEERQQAKFRFLDAAWRRT